MRRTVSIKACGLSDSTSISIESIPAKRLNNSDLPSITGLDAKGPRLPRPKIAVPSVITATRLPFAVYLYAFSGSSAMAFTGSATPGLYAKERSRDVCAGVESSTLIFPGFGN